MKATIALLALVCAILAAPAYATGPGYYGEEEDAEICANKGGIVDSRDGTTGLKWTEDGLLQYWHETIHTCGNGTEEATRADLGEPFAPPGNMKPPVVPNAEHVPDAPPMPCEDGYYDGDGYHEEVCP